MFILNFLEMLTIRKITLRKYGEKYSEEFIVNYYVNNHTSIRKMAKELNISVDEIRYFLKKNNIHKKQSPGDFDEYRLHKINKTYFQTIDSEDKAYFLGFIYADGYVTKDALYWTSHKQDRHILEIFCHYIETDKDCIKTIDEKYLRVVITSKEFASCLQKQGAVQAKTLILTPPSIPKNLIPHFIRGYFDGDGSIYYDKNTKSYRVNFLGTESMLFWIKDFFQVKTKIRPYKKIAKFDFSGNRQVFQKLSMIYNNSSEELRLKRKYEKFLSCKEKYEYQEKHRKETWINNLGPYIRNGVSEDCELFD